MFRIQGQVLGLQQVMFLVDDLLEVDEHGIDGVAQRRMEETVEGMDPAALELMGLGGPE